MGLLDALRDKQFRQGVGQGLLDVGQEASNQIAQNLSVPVDLLAWGLRKAGLPIPENPLGGSDWMAQNGLTKQVQPGYAKLAGETLGLIAPLAATKQGSSALAQQLLKYGENLNAPTQLSKEAGAIVWHGSPHKFDKYDASKIGTGEGAQAYGRGHYFGGVKETGAAYRDALAQGFDFPKNTPDDIKYAADTLRRNYQGSFEAILKDANPTYPPAKKALEMMKSGEITPKGYLYKVDLPDSAIAKMLDWDKPLSQQAPEVQKAITQLKKSDPQGYAKLVEAQLGGPVMEQATGRDLYKAINHDAFQSAGIPGIRYLDGGSRGAGSGTSNYVVFPGNEGLLNILERNGVPLK